MRMEENEVSEHGRFWLSGAPIEEPRLVPTDAATGTLKIDADGEIKLKLDLALITESVGKDCVIQGYLPHSGRFVRLEQIEAIHPIIARYCLIGAGQLAGASPIEDITDIRVPLDGFEQWLGVAWPKFEETERGENILSLRHRNIGPMTSALLSSSSRSAAIGKWPFNPPRQRWPASRRSEFSHAPPRRFVRLRIQFANWRI